MARKAFWPAKIPFPLVHIDTGHNFPETIEFRNNLAEKLGAELIAPSVQDSIDKGRVKEETGKDASRNWLQITTLLDAIEEHQFDALMGAPDGMKRRPELKSVSFRIETTLDNGIRKISALSSGTCITGKRVSESILEFSYF